jgi:hypothetical protein
MSSVKHASAKEDASVYEYVIHRHLRSKNQLQRFGYVYSEGGGR